jgi:peptidoglycan hydrolase CwlO-like protein
MKQEIEKRLQSLIAEFKTGEHMLADLETQQANLKVTLARISGAIQVLQELLQQEIPDSQALTNAEATETRQAA